MSHWTKCELAMALAKCRRKKWKLFLAPFVWRKIIPCRRVTRLHELPSLRANFSDISLQNVAKRSHEEQKDQNPCAA